MATKHNGYTIYHNPGGTDVATAGKQIILQDGFFFRDLAATGKLLPFEDWRLTPEERAKDLVQRLTPEQMIGLMPHSSSQPVPAMPGQMEVVGTYDGKEYPESDTANKWDLTDQQKDMVARQGIRHMLVSKVADVETAVRWSNALQALAESQPFGIPVNLSSDPRHGSGGEDAEFHAAASDVSQWPEGLALAAAADPEIARSFGEVMAREYRAMGIVTFLGPQIDLASDPRWFRIRDTLGSDTEKIIAMTRSFCDGLQTTLGSSSGWGKESVLAMAKHWPGGGTGEGGRDAHYPFGKYAVYPGGNFAEHLRPFLEGAFQLPGKTGSCAAVMPYYTISWNQDVKKHENVGNAYSEYLIRDLLIEKYSYDGLICTDWGITRDKTPHIGMYVLGGKCHGVEHLTQEQRILKLMRCGVNQFGGLDSREKVDEAYHLGCKEYGSEEMNRLLQISACKALRNLFRVGLFDNPYLDEAESKAIVGCRKFVAMGLDAQRRSAVLLKNERKVLPLKKSCKVYIPNRHVDAHYSFVRMMTPAAELDPLFGGMEKPWFTRVSTPEEADAALVFIDSPLGRNGYEFNMMNRAPQPDAGYYPISLQYRPYTAALARPVSIAGGDPREEGNNRTYRGRTEITANSSDLDLVLSARDAMGEKPVVVVVRMEKPAVVAEFEPAADAIVADFGISKRAILEKLAGEHPFTGKLPVILPANMETVETHCEDVPDDIEPYIDASGNRYTPGFGL